MDAISPVEVTINNHIATILMNVQTLTPEFNQAFCEAIDNLDNDKNVRVIVVKSAHPKIFFAGGDIKSMGEMKGHSMSEMSADLRANCLASYHVMEKLEYAKKPSIAAIDGAAMGGGCELCLACDISIASESSFFGFPEVKIGIIAAAGGTTRLPKRVGKQRAMNLLLTGKSITAQEAYQIGIIAQVVPKEFLYEEVEKTAKMIENNAPIAIQSTKAVVAYAESLFERGLGSLSVDTSLENCFSSRDFTEGVDAFLQKRNADFKGE